MGKYNATTKAAYYLRNRDNFKADAKIRYLKDPELWKFNVRKNRLRKLYFPELTADAAWSRYLEMQKTQNYLCAICKKPETKVDPQLNRACMLAVDHCHVTKKVRSLLCFRCNTNLGSFENMKQEFLEYLEKHK